MKFLAVFAFMYHSFCFASDLHKKPSSSLESTKLTSLKINSFEQPYFKEKNVLEELEFSVKVKRSNGEVVSYSNFPMTREAKAVTGFFAVENDMMIIGPEIKLPTDGSRTVKVSRLDSLGIKKGTIFNYVDFKTGKKSSYVFKDEVNFAPGYIDIAEKLTGYVILLRDFRKDEVIKRPQGGGDAPTGVGYLGSQFKIKAFNPNHHMSEISFPELIQAQRVLYPHTEFLEKKISRFKTDSASFYQVEWTEKAKFKIDSSLFYQDELMEKSNEVERSSKFSLVWEKGPNEFMNFSGDWNTTDNRTEYNVLNFIDGADWVIKVNSSVMHTCFSLMIYKDMKFYNVSVYCDSGGC